MLTAEGLSRWLLPTRGLESRVGIGGYQLLMWKVFLAGCCRHEDLKAGLVLVVINC